MAFVPYQQIPDHSKWRGGHVDVDLLPRCWCRGLSVVRTCRGRPTYRFCMLHFRPLENLNRPQMGRGRNRHIMKRFSATEIPVTADKASIHGSHLAFR